MFSIFNKRSKIHIDCFTSVEELPKLFPILHAKDAIPSFWQKLPPTVEFAGPTRGTMKLCPGVGDLYRTGLILQAWHDIFISVDGQLSWEPKTACESHNSLQHGGHFKNHQHIKIVSPWRFVEKTGVKFLYTNTFWHDENFKPVVVNGIVEYKYQNTTSTNMMVPNNIFPKSFTIPAGKPLAQIIPLSEKDVEFKMHVITDQEYLKMDPYVFTFSGSYFKRKKALMDQEKK